MKKVFFGFCVLTSAYLIQSCSGGSSENKAQDPVDSAKAVNKVVKPVEKDASDFAIKAANGNMMEIETGKLTQDKAINPRINVDMMVDDHEKDVAEFRKAADNCSDSSLKEFARQTLPVLEKHLDSIRAITGKK